MAEHSESLTEWPEGRSRRIQRAVIMHGTSEYRLEAAGLMAQLLQDSGASGVAFGWTDALNPGLLAPVHMVANRPTVRWPIHRSRTLTEAIDRPGDLRWKLLLQDVPPGCGEAVRPRIEYLKGFLADAARPDIPSVERRGFAFIELLDAYRSCGFFVSTRHLRSITSAFRAEVDGLPEGARAFADRVVELLPHRTRLQAALPRLGRSLDEAGSFRAAADVHVIAYDLALHRCRGRDGIDAARGAGRALRREGDLTASLQWYELAGRIAEFEEDWGRLALALDGAGNTLRHQGSFPRARARYERAWKCAVIAQDPVAIGNVATSMAVVRRWAGDTEAASRYAWTAVDQAQNRNARARAMISLGSILREGGDLENAVRAYSLAQSEAQDRGYRALATDALAYCAAIRGDSQEYDRLRGEVRDARIREPFLRAQIGLFRARSLAAFGHADQARRVLGAVERYAHRWSLAQWEVEAGELEPSLGRPRMDTPYEVQQGLRALQVAPI